MHEGQYEIDEHLASALISDQFPHLANLSLRRVRSSGTVNAIFRLGDHLAARFPLLPEYSTQAPKEARWLPKLAPRLPLRIPEPIGVGQPTELYPEAWSVVRWIPGGSPTGRRRPHQSETALRLGEFVAALQAVEVEDNAPVGYRSRPLRSGEGEVRRAIGEVGDEFDETSLARIWESALQAPAWEGPPRWHHGDLHPANLVFRGDDLVGVLDFGLVGVGDPAVDAMAAWWVFSSESRVIYRTETGCTDGEWERGRGWTLAVALIALPYYRETNPILANLARRAIGELIADS